MQNVRFCLLCFKLRFIIILLLKEFKNTYFILSFILFQFALGQPSEIPWFTKETLHKTMYKK